MRNILLQAAVLAAALALPWSALGQTAPLPAAASPTALEPFEAKSPTLTKLAKLWHAMDKDCIEVYDLDDNKRDPRREIIVGEADSCEERQAEVVKLAATDPVAAAQLWWYLFARQYDLLPEKGETLGGVNMHRKLPKECAKHECSGREEQTADQIVEAAAREPRVHSLVWGLQELVAGRVLQTAKGPNFASKYWQICAALRMLTDHFGCEPLEWQSNEKPVCAQWWLDWFARNRGHAAQWPKRIAGERMAALQSKDLVERLWAMGPPDEQKARFKDVIFDAALAPWLDPNTPRDLAERFQRVLENFGFAWTEALHGRGKVPRDWTWAVVPQPKLPELPADPSAASAPALAPLTPAQRKAVKKLAQTATDLYNVINEESDDSDDARDPMDDRANKAMYKKLMAANDPLVNAHVLVDWMDQTLDSLGEGDAPKPTDPPGFDKARDHLRATADSGQLLLLLIKRFAAKVKEGEPRDVERTEDDLRALTGHVLCAWPLPVGESVRDCVALWNGFAAVHLAEGEKAWKERGLRRALGDATGDNIKRKYVGCRALYHQPEDSAAHQVFLWSVRNLVLSVALTDGVRGALNDLAYQWKPLDILYPAAKGERSKAPNLLAPPAGK